ncbi:GIY-YIG nuclease family protein [Pseudocolwellia sp. AS88]|uniref:GIY-YIG nuclease family protein n=1 Tax=Pseudocolwellia sp. AS88 TaxID=3063958 RepID=UPI0026EED7BD|nr:GIY-YIG nuclease family protein [Pseudocolwellia sp. AS88]MDO7086277.1 GIY-YIG nuclease family protein [Pseudocolwellia sp. AS88]
MIYFVKAEITKRIKIGYTAQWIDTRLSSMQSNSPDKLTFLGGFVGNKELEINIQNSFRENLSHGEWYNESKDLYSYIEVNCLKDKFSFDWICDAISDNSISFEYAKLLDDIKIRELSQARIKYAFDNSFKNIVIPDFGPQLIAKKG